MKKITIAQGQIALTSKNGDFKQLLSAGEHRLNDWFNKIDVMIYSLDHEPIEKTLAERLRQYHADWVAQYCVDIHLADDEIGFLYLHNNLVEVMAPNTRRLYWKMDSLRVEIQSVNTIALTDDEMARVFNKKNIKGDHLYTLTQIATGQLGMLTIDGEIRQLLAAGHYGYWHINHQIDITVFDTQLKSIDNAIENGLAEHLRQYHQDWVTNYCVDINLLDNEFAFLYLHNNLVEILAPATRRLYWKNADALRIEKLQTGQLEVESSLINRLMAKKKVKGAEICLITQIPAWHVGVLKIDGEIHSLLQSGTYGYWKIEHKPEVEIIDTRLQSLEVSGQEILTKDKVTLRINLSANWRYNDILLAFSSLSQPVDYLYKELQFALREIVGTRSLDKLLENKQLVDELMLAQITQCVAEFGLEINSVGVKDIILPGEMRTILAQVVEAEKSAQANVIRRREETAATRSLLNTAKVMENNPIALRLKELETLESIAHRIDQISVYGGLDNVLNGLVKIKE